MIYITDEERRSRLVSKMRLDPEDPVTDPVDLVNSLVAVHVSDPTSPFIALASRSVLDDPIQNLEDSFYVTEELVKMHVVRGTIFVVSSSIKNGTAL